LIFEDEAVISDASIKSIDNGEPQLHELVIDKWRSGGVSLTVPFLFNTRFGAIAEEL
jgi:hypothetical protein